MYWWGKHAKLLRIGSFIQWPLPPTAKNQYGVTRLAGLRWSRKFNVKTIQTPKTSMDLAGLASSRRPRDVQTVTYAMVREARRISFSSIYANYADIFNHRSMEKDKLFVLDVCGAYGQKDINKLDRSEMNKPARGIS